MKFVISQNDKKSVWFITVDMLRVLSNASIQFDQMSKLHRYGEKLTPSEIASILALQNIMARKLGVPTLPPVFDGIDVIQKTLLTSAFNSVDSEELMAYAAKHNKFYVHAVQDGLVIAMGSKTQDVNPAGWDPLKSDTFPEAVLEALYDKLGYMDVHFKEANQTAVNEFSLADVLNLIAVS